MSAAEELSQIAIQFLYRDKAQTYISSDTGGRLQECKGEVGDWSLRCGCGRESSDGKFIGLAA